MVKVNLYGVYVGGNRKDYRSQIEIVAESMKQAREKAWEWLGDKDRETALSVTGLVGWTKGKDVPSELHPLYQSVARRKTDG